MPVFVLGCAALAVWIAVRLPALGPASARGCGLHLTATLVIGFALGPILHTVPGLPSAPSVLVALFVLALPAITYMLLVGLWLVQLATGQAPPARS